jgi:transposase InsO family protein
LRYYDPADKTRVIADASPVGLGAVLVQFKDKIPRIIYYISKSLSAVERRYSQCEKEALALVWSVERLSMFLIGKKFQLVTDHKPLQAIFKPESKPCARIQRWVLRLQSFNFDVIYCEGKQNIADPLSRLCCSEDAEAQPFDPNMEEHVMHLAVKSIPRAVSLEEIQNVSSIDEEIQSIKRGLNEDDWDEIASKYKIFVTELGFCGEILLRGNKIVIPKTLQQRILELAHEGHPGTTRMKQRLRMKVWWYKLDSMVETFVKNCTGCQIVSRPSGHIPMKRRELPSAPWEDLAIDYLGPLPSGHHLLVVIDYYSRFQKIFLRKSTSSSGTIAKLKQSFADFGVPKTITADNAPYFTSEEFQNFCKDYGIHLINTIPYWPQMNGEVEVQNRSVLKQLIISQNTKGSDWENDLSDYLLMYHATNHPATSKSPLELMTGRVPRDKLPMIREDLNIDSEVRDKDKIYKEKGKEYADSRRHAKESDINIGDQVLVKNYNKTNKLSPNFQTERHTVEKVNGGDVIITGNETGVSRRRYVGHLKKVGENEIAEKLKPVIPEESLQKRRSLDDNEILEELGQRPKRIRTAPIKLSDYQT